MNLLSGLFVNASIINWEDKKFFRLVKAGSVSIKALAVISGWIWYSASVGNDKPFMVWLALPLPPPRPYGSKLSLTFAIVALDTLSSACSFRVPIGFTFSSVIDGVIKTSGPQTRIRLLL